MDVDPFVSMVGQPVPEVDPLVLKQFWTDTMEFRVKYPDSVKAITPDLETQTLAYRMDILFAILRGTEPTEEAFQAGATLPLVWPAYETEFVIQPK